jgi:hypothetical protein
MIIPQPHVDKADAKHGETVAPKRGGASGRRIAVILLAILIVSAMVTWIGFLIWGAFALIRGLAS